jgi:hypothetical protein
MLEGRGDWEADRADASKMRLMAKGDSKVEHGKRHP